MIGARGRVRRAHPDPAIGILKPSVSVLNMVDRELMRLSDAAYHPIPLMCGNSR